jgi:hypothetical protein
MSDVERDSQGREVIRMNPDAGMQADPANQPQPLLDEHVYNTRTPTDSRVTHPAMTWQEEVVWADELEASGVDLTDEEKARIDTIHETAAAHEALAEAQKAEREQQQQFQQQPRPERF